MKRVIKFKAWHPRLEMMFTVYSLDFDNGLVFCESEEDTRHTFGMIDVELLQFTGYQDKSGADIYEGHIFKPETPCDGDSVIEVEYDYFSYLCQIQGENDAWGVNIDPEKGEILGNKYQNAELLE